MRLKFIVNRWGTTSKIINAQKVLISDGSNIDISGSTGPGGSAIIWSDKETTMLGDVKANGTVGGAVEISSKDTLRHVCLFNINISEGGHLLLDPKNITIGDAASSQNWIYQGLIGFDYSKEMVSFGKKELELANYKSDLIYHANLEKKRTIRNKKFDSQLLVFVKVLLTKLLIPARRPVLTKNKMTAKQTQTNNK